MNPAATSSASEVRRPRQVRSPARSQGVDDGSLLGFVVVVHEKSFDREDADHDFGVGCGGPGGLKFKLKQAAGPAKTSAASSGAVIVHNRPLPRETIPSATDRG